MKTIVLILLIAVATSISAQKSQVEEAVMKIAGGNNNTLIVMIKEADRKSVVKEWTNVMKGNKAKVKGKREIFADNALMPLISSNTVDVYAIATQLNNDVRFAVAFDLDGTFLSSKSHPAQYFAAEKIISDFAIGVSRKNYQSSLASERKSMSSMEKRKKSLEKGNSSMQRDNNKMKQRIERNEKTIEQNTKEIETINKDIKDIKSRIDNLEKNIKKLD